MTVTVIDVAGHNIPLESNADSSVRTLPSAAVMTLVAGALCNDGGRRTWTRTVDRSGSAIPTETALLQAAADAGLDVARTAYSHPACRRATRSTRPASG